jgi:CubicO group peptidase (beta-lactamase class C family)
MSTETDPFGSIDRWPASHVAVGSVVRSGTIAAHGELDRPFPLASVTKVLTTAATLIAIEEEIVDLDEPWGPHDATVRHLLAHAAGIAANDDRVLAPPGTRRIYSNAGFELLGDLVAQRAAMPFGQYLREALTEPLGMTGTALEGSPAHGAQSTLHDLLAFGHEILAPTLLADETLALARVPAYPELAGVLPGFGRKDPNLWGLGFEIRGTKDPHWTGTTCSPATFGHFGRSGTFFWVDPEVDLVVVCLTDRDFGTWALERWPALSDAIRARFGRG